MNPKSEDEIYLRIAILEAYTSTRHYKDQYSKCHQKIEQAHKKHMLWKNGQDVNQYDEKQCYRHSWKTWFHYPPMQYLA